MAPIIAAAVNIGGLILNTVTSVIRDKKNRNKPTEGHDLLIPSSESAADMIASGMSISSKRLVNLSGTGLMFMMAVKSFRSEGLTLEVIGLLALATTFSIAMAWITKKSEE